MCYNLPYVLMIDTDPVCKNPAKVRKFYENFAIDIFNIYMSNIKIIVEIKG